MARQAAIIVVAIVVGWAAVAVGYAITHRDPCAASDIEKTKFGTRRMCEYVREQQRAGLELHDCVKQDGQTYCIMIDWKRGDDADLP